MLIIGHQYLHRFHRQRVPCRSLSIVDPFHVAPLYNVLWFLELPMKSSLIMENAIHDESAWACLRIESSCWTHVNYVVNYDRSSIVVVQRLACAVCFSVLKEKNLSECCRTHPHWSSAVAVSTTYTLIEYTHPPTSGYTCFCWLAQCFGINNPDNKFDFVYLYIRICIPRIFLFTKITNLFYVR